MQPEKSTLPLAGIFEDSLYTVKFLLRHTQINLKFLSKNIRHILFIGEILQI